MKKTILTACTLLLASCGFHLKGSAGTSPQMPYQNWYVEPGTAIHGDLETALKRVGAKLVAHDKAQAVLSIRHIGERREIYTVTRASLVNEYLLTLHVSAQAYRDGKPFGPEQSVVVQRTMDYTESEVLGKQEEEETIWADMRRDAAEQIARRLTFLKAQ